MLVQVSVRDVLVHKDWNLCLKATPKKLDQIAMTSLRQYRNLVQELLLATSTSMVGDIDSYMDHTILQRAFVYSPKAAYAQNEMLSKIFWRLLELFERENLQWSTPVLDWRHDFFYVTMRHALP